jgi:AraC-like DNA-binding protein
LPVILDFATIMIKVKSRGELENVLDSFVRDGNSESIRIHDKQLGQFECDVQHYTQFSYVKRNFINGDEFLTIPVRSSSPLITMIFQFGGLSAYRDRHNPYIISHHQHSLNYFNEFDCKNFLERNATQHDVTFTLDESFFEDIITDQAGVGNLVSDKILNKKEFNTITSKQSMDASVASIIHNIMFCEYKGPSKDVFITTQLRALLMLQLCTFHYWLTGKEADLDPKITQRDRDILFGIREYLNENYMDDTSLLDITRRFGINEFKLKYGFKKIFNSSPIKFQQERKLDFAAELLRSSDKSISEISDTVGYQHSNNFSLAFKKRFGIGPALYRRN